MLISALKSLMVVFDVLLKSPVKFDCCHWSGIEGGMKELYANPNRSHGACTWQSSSFALLGLKFLTWVLLSDLLQLLFQGMVFYPPWHWFFWQMFHRPSGKILGYIYLICYWAMASQSKCRFYYFLPYATTKPLFVCWVIFWKSDVFNTEEWAWKSFRV